MALGFGFNKTKVLQAAERYVLQGKLQNAINEYEKVAQADPGDLTVANTIGDLYVRVGRLEEGLQCFRKVAEAYNAQGFLVKAIAMFKKMAKLSPSAVDCMQKLAELYGQQGLFSDARAQYTSLAELHLKNGDSEAAVNVYRKVLELDPENAAMQQRLADLYRRAGRNSEAAEIYVMAAQSLQCRRNFAAALEAVEKVLSFEPRNEAALLLRAKIAVDAGQPALAIQSLEALPGLDQRAEALHELLRASVAAGDLTSAEATALKLLRVHNDPAGMLEAAAALVGAGEPERGLRLVRDHVEAIATPAASTLATFLNESLPKAKDNVPALEKVCELYRMIGERGSSHEASEMLAHAYTEAGRLAEAREIYRHLAEVEPENPLHHQNYTRVATQMGETDTRPVNLAAEEEAVVPEQLPDHEVSVPQQYLSQIEEAIENALTDSELYQSYNAMPRAIAPLEAVLLKAPEDVRLNQRLAALYVRVERYADAADRFSMLRTVFEREHLESEAAQCAEMEQKYRERAGTRPPTAPAQEPAAAEFEVPALEMAAAADPAVPEFSASTEWDAIAQPQKHADTAAEPAARVETAEPAHAARQPQVSTRVAEILDEAQFYLQQGMAREARAALDRCRELTPDDPAVLAMEAQLGAEPVRVAEPEAAHSAEPVHAQTEMIAEPAPEPVPPVHHAEMTAHREAPQSVAFTESAAAAEQVAAAAAFDIGWNLDDLAPVAAAEAPQVASAPPLAFETAPQPYAAEERKPQLEAVSAKVESSAAEAVSDGAVPTGAEDFSMDAIFKEFRAEVEKTDGAADDLESRYNLGIAFKDMGLYDEAIGELQKVCNAIDRGAQFHEAVQAYTWLAHCFVERRFPQAAFKWYERALQLPGLEPESVVAIHYDLAQAYERAGIKEHALQHFMEAYGSNIDYRDVAERIHALQG
jgi:tetratricopeptide (TPR) repeat protein